MEAISVAHLKAFLERLGKRYRRPATLYLLGGSALCLLGSPRTTVDVDYTFDVEPEEADRFQSVLAELAAEMRLDLDDVPLAEFIPLPPEAHERRQLVGRFGQLEVYIFDPYSIALSKIARGFEADLEDVVFLWREGLIAFGELERHFRTVLPRAAQADIIPREFEDYFEEVRRRIAASSSTRG
jgi:hypothetical protein